MERNNELSVSEAQLELMLARAAEVGAKKALHSIGLHDDDAASDVKELRGLLDSWRDAKKTAWRTFIGWATKGLLVMLALGAWYQLKAK